MAYPYGVPEGLEIQFGQCAAPASFLRLVCASQVQVDPYRNVVLG